MMMKGGERGGDWMEGKSKRADPIPKNASQPRKAEEEQEEIRGAKGGRVEREETKVESRKRRS